MEFTAQSGAKVMVGVAPFQDAMALKNAIARELKGSNIDLSDIKNKDVTALMDAVLSVDSSVAVQTCLMPCLARCTYNGLKITADTFEAETAREDYYDVVIACLKANLSPFFKGLISKLSALPDQTKDVAQK